MIDQGKCGQRELVGTPVAILCDALRPVLFHPVARHDEARERFGELDHQGVADRGRKTGPRLLVRIVAVADAVLAAL